MANCASWEASEGGKPTRTYFSVCFPDIVRETNHVAKQFPCKGRRFCGHLMEDGLPAGYTRKLTKRDMNSVGRKALKDNFKDPEWSSCKVTQA